MRKLLVAIAMIAVLMAVPTSGLAASGTVIYDSTLSPLPPSMPSLGFQATQTAEFGDLVQFAGTSRVLNTVTVTMVTWATHGEYPSMPSTGYDHPITMNIYGVDNSGPVPAIGSLLATDTESFMIPWRPVGDPTCPVYTPGGPNAWRASDGNCYFGYAFNITFDMSSFNLTLPEQVIFGIAYNTQTWGYDPIGTPGPYNSLNVGLNDQTSPSVGTDVNSDAVFWNTETAGWYADGGAAGVGIFRQDTNWAPYVPAVRFTATTPPPTDMSQCKDDGWQQFNAPAFTNQGQCVSYVQANEHAGK